MNYDEADVINFTRIDEHTFVTNPWPELIKVDIYLADQEGPTLSRDRESLTLRFRLANGNALYGIRHLGSRCLYCKLLSYENYPANHIFENTGICVQTHPLLASARLAANG